MCLAHVSTQPRQTPGHIMMPDWALETSSGAAGMEPGHIRIAINPVLANDTETNVYCLVFEI